MRLSFDFCFIQRCRPFCVYIDISTRQCFNKATSALTSGAVRFKLCPNPLGLNLGSKFVFPEAKLILHSGQ
jgi:hypothetical protein